LLEKLDKPPFIVTNAVGKQVKLPDDDIPDWLK